MKIIASCFEDCMLNIDLNLWDSITVYSMSEKTMRMQAKEYAVCKINEHGFFCEAVDYSHTLFLPIYPAFNVWVFKRWDLPVKIDPYLHKMDDLICINIIGDNMVQTRILLEEVSAGFLSETLKSRILFTPTNCEDITIPLYPTSYNNLYTETNTKTMPSEMEVVYVLYGKKACELYDQSFEKLFRSKKAHFDIQKYGKNDYNKAMKSKTKLGCVFRKISVVEYGLLLSKRW